MQDLREDLTRLIAMISGTDGVIRSDKSVRAAAGAMAHMIRCRLDAGVYPAPLRHPVIEAPNWDRHCRN